MNGILNINKPQGWTSRDIVNVVAKAVRPGKAGHAGTLDPLATGVLLVCVGRATRLISEIHEHPKTYEARFRLGKQSDTEDVEGTVVDVPVPQDITEDRLNEKLGEFTGTIQQIPPVFSAKKIRGRRAYEAARRGETVELKPSEVVIHRLELTDFSFPEFSLSITCGTGTYVRSLGRDIARSLGTEAIMTELTRTAIGPMSIAGAVDIENLRARDAISLAIHDPLDLLTHLPRIPVNTAQAERIRNGQRLSATALGKVSETSASRVAVTDELRNLVAIGTFQRGQFKPMLVFPSEPQ